MTLSDRPSRGFAATQLCSEDYSVGIAVSTEFGASWCKAFWSNGSKLFQLPSGAPDLGCQWFAALPAASWARGNKLEQVRSWSVEPQTFTCRSKWNHPTALHALSWLDRCLCLMKAF